MKSVLDKTTRDELIERINALSDKSSARWGKMNVHQMLKHCILCEEMFLGKKKYKRAFIGRIFGKIGLSKILKDETPLGQNAPTANEFKNLEASGDLEVEKANWISLINEYSNYSNNDFEHWFFGKMTKDQVGQFDYKHIDHHLRQFRC
jgi:hypothetical protein